VKRLEQIAVDEASLAARRIADESVLRGTLWDLINAYVVSCGGDPSKHVYGNTTRQRAVAAIERLVFPKERR
jgi:hypothetical protein